MVKAIPKVATKLEWQAAATVTHSITINNFQAIGSTGHS
jgi:hypothetical protein